jgi:hypothetical protein
MFAAVAAAAPPTNGAATVAATVRVIEEVVSMASCSPIPSEPVIRLDARGNFQAHSANPVMPASTLNSV